VFGIQEGETYDWGTITGFLSVPLLIGFGVVMLGVFIWWQGHMRGEPLVPLSLFRDRNFSLSNAAITTVGFAITGMAFPLMLFTQAVLGYSPTKSALLLVPMAVLSGALAPIVGRFVDTVHPRYITTAGLLLCSISLFWVSRVMTPDVAVWQLLLPMALLGVANAGMWAPLAATATRNLPMRSAGAGAGIYNTTRQVGAVLGSAAIAAVIEGRLAANLGAAAGSAGGSGAGAAAGGTGGTGLPPQVASGFASAMSEAMLLPAAVLLLGVVAVLFFVKPSFAGKPANAAAAEPTGAGPAPADAAAGVAPA